MVVATMHQPSSVEQRNLVVLGDQTCNVSTLLKDLFLDATQSAAQTEFVRDSSAALRAQADRLRPFQQERLPAFKSIHDLARIYDQSHGVCHPSISGVLLCVTQLLQLFRYFEGRGRRPETQQHTYTVGLCTGSLVAAVYAASGSVDDLKVLAVPTVSMAFQLGLQAATASSMLYEQGTPLRSWSIAIPSMIEDEALSALTIYDAGGQLSMRHRCFVSAVGLKSVTISGAPPALNRFAESLTAAQPSRKIVRLPVFAAYHAAHIHPFLDFPSFLTRCGIQPTLLGSFKPVHTLLSPLTGLPVVANDALGLFQTVVQDTLQAPLRLDLIVDRFAAIVRETHTSTVSVDVVGPTTVADSLVAAFQARTSANVSTRDLVAPVPGVDDYRPVPSFSNAPLAIVGMSGRFPDADSAEALWNLLSEGKDTHRVIPNDRFDAEKHVDADGKTKNTSWTPYGCFINRPGAFDPRFFNMSPKEALQTDPMQRMALVTAYEALEQAGFVPDRTRSTALNRVGTFYGQTSDDYRDVNSAQDIGTYFITGGIRAFGPGRINYFFKFSGPSYSVDTACSSSLAAIQLACTALWSGECDTAVAGGLSVLTSPDLFSGLSRGQFLSKTGSCKTFDNGADGYCRADGIGTVVIKRLSDAELDRDNVLAVVLGAATNHSAQAVSITHPHAETQSSLYRDVLQHAGVDPHDVGYVEMHGTGTQAGDGTEMRSVTDVFAPVTPRRSEDNPLYVGAVKANIGHGEASSGVVSLIKAMLMLKNFQIPPHVGIKDTINHGFPDLQARNVRIAYQMTPLQKKKNQKLTMLINNFSAAGGNTAVLIQEPPSLEVKTCVEPRRLHPVTVSGHTISALLNNLDRLIAFLTANPGTSPLDLSYTTTARRRHHAYRATVVESSTARIVECLERKRVSLTSDHKPQHADSVVFTFTGQGAAYPALARDLYITSTQFKADIVHFDGIARQQGFTSFLSMIDGTVTELALLSPMQTQIGLVCIQIALARLWSSFGIKPAAVIGHSLGEYAALQIAGVLSISDTIFLVGCRARLLESRCEENSHAMLAVGESPAVVQSISPNVVSGVDIACTNSPREIVYAGPKATVDGLDQKLKEHKIRSTKLQVAYAFHSAQVDSILRDFEEIAKVVHMGTPNITIISSTAGRILGADDKIDAQYLVRHCRQTVKFSGAVKHAKESGLITETTTLIEIGPHPICSGMIRSTLGSQIHTLPTLRRKESAWAAIVGSLAALHDAGFKINWSEYQRDFEDACRLIHLPVYAFDEKNYWIDYRHDWTLRKGDPLLTTVTSPQIGHVTPSAPQLISSSVHRVVQENYNAKQPVVVFETDLSHPDMHAAISGHSVNGSALCPSSLYADIALTVARHVQEQPASDMLPAGHDVSEMEVHQPLIIKPLRKDENRILRVSARPDRQSRSISLEYISTSPGQKSETKHANCHIRFGSTEKWLKRWSSDLHLIQERIVWLKALSESGNVDKITTRLAYRLFANLVDYSPQYQTMNQVLLDAEGLEATANVRLDDRGANANFAFSPYFLDGLLHLSGFIMNGSDTTDHKQAVYISHGWESLRLAKPLEVNGEYQVYVKMLPRGKSMVAGNLYVLYHGEIVGQCEEIMFQRVPRAVLDMLLPSVGHKRVTPASPVAMPENKSKRTETQAHPMTTTSAMKQETVHQNDLLDVIASEIGIGASEIKPHDGLADLGVDSLMSLAMAGQFVRQFDINVDHTEVMHCSTIDDLLSILQKKRSGTVALTPPADDDSANSSGDDLLASSPAGSTGATTPMTNYGGETSNLVHSIVVQETGIAPEDLDPLTDLSDLGVDSLMSLAILSKLRDAGVDLPMTFFAEHRTMQQIFTALSAGTSNKGSDVNHLATDNTDEQAAQTSQPGLRHQTLPGFEAKSVLLQKRTISSSNTVGGALFLFPDGSGSPAAYAGLSQLSPVLDVYGLVCPFLKDPSAYTCGLETTVGIYLRTILAHQPTGPYHLGGWSVGGVLAFEAARQLVEVHGQEISGLVLIDAPCPLVLPPMDGRLIDFLDSRGVFSTFKDGQRAAVNSKVEESAAGRKKRETVLQHFDATVRNLGQYHPEPLSPGRTPIKTLILWAREGVLDEGDDSAQSAGLSDDPIAGWILNGRKDLGSHGWGDLLAEECVKIASVEGNHFSMIAGQNVNTLSGHLQAHFDGIL